MSSTVELVPVGELPMWPTKRMMGLRKRLLRCEESLALSDVEDPSEVDPSTIRFKEDPRWSELYDRVRTVLATREHIRR